MTNVISWIQGLIEFKKQACREMSKHESSEHRIITVEETYKKLAALNLKQDDLFRQAIRCVEVEVFRAAHVLGWATMADYLQEWLSLDNFLKLKGVRPKWKKLTSLEDLREHSEFQMIEAFRACGYCSKPMEKALKGLLSKRNDCAHPSDYYPDLNVTLGYLSDLLIRFEMLDTKKKTLFP